MAPAPGVEPRADLFPHGADIGVRSIGPSRASAFEQTALAPTSAVTDPAGVVSRERIEVTREAPDYAYLLLDWLNALIYEMAVRRLVTGVGKGRRQIGMACPEGACRALAVKMGTASAIMVGPRERPEHASASSCHGAGRRLSRHRALKQWHGRPVVDELREHGIIGKSPSMRGVAEEAPGAYKNVVALVEAAHRAGLSRKVATLLPVICIKG